MKAFAFLALALSAAAQSSSEHYSITAAAAGGTASGTQFSDAYSQHASAGGVFGLADQGSISNLNAGFPAQLAEIIALLPVPPQATIEEGGMLNYSADYLFDDGAAAPAGDEVHWTITAGSPLAFAGPGEVLALNVTGTTQALLAARTDDFTAWMEISVRNTGDDDFGLYARDGISDAWQIFWFGEENPLGRPDADGDGDGQDNAMEFAAGYSPADFNERLTFRFLDFHGDRGRLELSRVVPGTLYDIEDTPNFAEWTLRSVQSSDTLREPFSFHIESFGPRQFFRAKAHRQP